MNVHVFFSDLDLYWGSLAKSPQLEMIADRENNSWFSEGGTCHNLTVVKCTLSLPGPFLLAGVVSRMYFKGGGIVGCGMFLFFWRFKSVNRTVLRKKKLTFKYICDFSIFQIFLKPALRSHCGFVYCKIICRDWIWTFWFEMIEGFTILLSLPSKRLRCF